MMKGTQMSLTLTQNEVVQRLRTISTVIVRDAVVGITGDMTERLDDDQATVVTRNITSAVDDLLALAADIMAPGYVDPRHLAKADLKALHDVHMEMGVIDRNIHLYLDGRATADAGSSPAALVPM